MFKISNITYRFIVIAVKAFTNLPDISPKIRRYEKLLAFEIMNVTIAVVTIVSSKIFGIFFILRVRYTKKERAKAYTAATAAASVGVNIPLIIPPKIITGVRTGKKAFSNLIKNSLKDILLSLG